MSAGARARFCTATDSKSLWNFTLNPGWSELDGQTLRLALLRYGCGNWKDISRHFPFKNLNQLNGQTQRAFGQQSLAEFGRLHIDPQVVRAFNERERAQAFRKNGCIVRTGTALNAAQKKVKRAIQEHVNSVPAAVATRMHLPVLNHYPREVRSVTHKLSKLNELYRTLRCCQVLSEERRKGKAVRTGLVVPPIIAENQRAQAQKERRHRLLLLQRTVQNTDEAQQWIAFKREHTRSTTANTAAESGSLMTMNVQEQSEQLIIVEDIELEVANDEKASTKTNPTATATATATASKVKVSAKAKTMKAKMKVKMKPKPQRKKNKKAKPQQSEIVSHFQPSDIIIVDIGDPTASGSKKRVQKKKQKQKMKKMSNNNNNNISSTRKRGIKRKTIRKGGDDDEWRPATKRPRKK